jgi:hypothetical protein
MFKTGDKIICINSDINTCSMITVGKIYKVIGIYKYAVRIQTDVDVISYAPAWFFTSLKEERKLKLKKLYNV